VIRTNGGDPAAIGPAATKVVRDINPSQPVTHVMTVSQIRDESIAPRRLNARLVTSFGFLALIVAAVGIAAVLAFSVSARTNEIGIRMSFGADAGSVQRMVLREGGTLVGIGLALGVVGSLVLSSAVKGLLFGVTARDPETLAVVAVIMTAVGVAACWIPAARGSPYSPSIAAPTVRSMWKNTRNNSNAMMQSHAMTSHSSTASIGSALHASTRKPSICGV
jgi:predicted lysophospholipase L1 biosynthesis ABC-type transport system permease subunit